MSTTGTRTNSQHRITRVIRQLLLVCLVALASTSGLAGLSTAPADAAAACPYGVWRYAQAMSGGCGHGQWSKGIDNLGRPWFKLTGLVGDDSADGSCARVEVKIRVQWAADTTDSYRVCGNGKTTPIDFSDLDTSSGLTGSVQAWSVRLCVGDSCKPYIDYEP